MKRYAVAITSEGEVIICERMTKPIKDAPDTIEEGRGMIPTWVNLWAVDETDAKERAMQMWKERNAD